MLNDLLPDSCAADRLVASAKQEGRQLTEAEEAFVREVGEMAYECTKVDEFERVGKEKNQEEAYVRPALYHTKFDHVHAPVSHVEAAVPVAAY
jgi:hypothetical protein